jgi:hypothetical protein
MVGRLVGWSVGQSISWSVGLSFVWLVVRSVKLFVGWLVGSVVPLLVIVGNVKIYTCVTEGSVEAI